ncbi:FUSC family protein [Francisella sp. 19X1-34]|uniref:FUSC family protein n=1 Tax=Francisella sp. 19X1-34 TaxID=3087177 RepID=UPI002E31A946|nr:FUSC family protein [Francisella sp. 19X1-34]MED7788077.1 FUSC family protein [Francisella sp. 19X1-34]
MFGLFKELFYIEYSSLNLKISIIGAIVCLISIFICIALHVENPFWAAPAVLAVISPNRNVIMYKAPRRLLATFIGSLIAIAIVLTFSNYPFLTLTIVLFLGAIILYLSKVTSENYFCLFLAVHILFLGIAIVFDPTMGYSVAEDRFIANIIGISLTCIVSSFIYKIPKGPKPSPKKSSKEDGILYTSVLIISIILAVVVWEIFKVPGGSLNMIISIITIAGINDSSSLLKGKQRLFGCLFGICAAFIAIALSTISTVLFLLSCFCFLVIFSYYYLSHKKHTYGGIQAVMGLVIMCFPHASMEISVSDGFYRALGVLLGVIIVDLVFRTFRYVFEK